MVTGPGNIWVAAAKRLLKGRIGIDSEAGPTEIAILADATADPVHVAADLISQAEHDTLAAAVLVTDSAELADAVEVELKAQVARTKHAERITEALAGRQSGIVLVSSIDDGLQVVDAYAAEHLEIQTARRRRRRRRASATPGRSSWGPTRPSRSATTWPGRTTCCPRAAAPATPRACRCRRSCKRRPRRRLQPRGPRRGRAAGVRAGRRRRPARPRRRDPRPVRLGDPRLMTTLDDLPIRDDLRGKHPTVRRSSTWRCSSTPTRTPTSRPRRCSTTWPGRSARAPRASTATPTATRSSCARTWPTTSATTSPPGSSGPPTGPTRSSSRCCRPSAAPGARRSASSRPTRCTRSSPPAPAPAGSRAAGKRTSRSTPTGRSGSSRNTGPTWSS